MNSKILDVLLCNVSEGLFLIQTNNCVYAENAIECIEGKLDVLHIDFNEHDAGYYDQHIHEDFEAVIFSNIESLGNPYNFLSNCNFNRDNFIGRKLPYYFIVPTCINNIMSKDFPNLYSYFVTVVNLDDELKPPFRQIMSMDRIRFSDIMMSFHYIPDMSVTEGLKELNGLLSKINKSYITTTKRTCLDLSNDDDFRMLHDLCEDYITCNQLLLYGARYDQVIILSKKLLGLLIRVVVRDTVVELDLDRILSLVHPLMLYLEDYKIVSQSQLVLILRQFATAVFYSKQYVMASQIFSILLELLEESISGDATQEEQEIILLVGMDLALCYKRGNLNDSYLLHMQNVIANGLSSQSDPEVLFMYRYNMLLYLLDSDNVIHVKSELEYYDVCKYVFSDKDPITLRLSVLVAWMLGCYNGQLLESIEIMRNSEPKIHSKFPENHYIIAESSYCYGVLCWLAGDMDTARLKIMKAINILRNDVNHNSTFISIMSEFMSEHLSS